MKWVRRILVLAVLLFAGPLWVASDGEIDLEANWRTARRDSAGIAPDPRTTREALVFVYAARVFHWRRVFAVHSWIATKEPGAPHYEVHQVVGWRAGGGRSVVYSRADIPDRYWYGSHPEVLVELRGAEAEFVIPKIRRAIADYPHARDYRMWPGPNSNTFTAHVARQVPELRLRLPTTAIGKDYLANWSLLARSPSGTGFQLSLYGLLGITLARLEGLELNLLGLNFGFEVVDPALKFPGIGRVDFARRHSENLAE